MLSLPFRHSVAFNHRFMSTAPNYGCAAYWVGVDSEYSRGHSTSLVELSVVDNLAVTITTPSANVTMARVRP